MKDTIPEGIKMINNRENGIDIIVSSIGRLIYCLKPILIRIGLDGKSIKKRITIKKILVDKCFIFSKYIKSI